MYSHRLLRLYLTVRNDDRIAINFSTRKHIRLCQQCLAQVHWHTENVFDVASEFRCCTFTTDHDRGYWGIEAARSKAGRGTCRCLEHAQSDSLADHRYACAGVREGLLDGKWAMITGEMLALQHEEFKASQSGA